MGYSFRRRMRAAHLSKKPALYCYVVGFLISTGACIGGALGASEDYTYTGTKVAGTRSDELPGDADAAAGPVFSTMEPPFPTTSETSTTTISTPFGAVARLGSSSGFSAASTALPGAGSSPNTPVLRRETSITSTGSWQYEDERHLRRENFSLASGSGGAAATAAATASHHEQQQEQPQEQPHDSLIEVLLCNWTGLVETPCRKYDEPNNPDPTVQDLKNWLLKNSAPEEFFQHRVQPASAGVEGKNWQPSSTSGALWSKRPFFDPATWLPYFNGTEPDIRISSSSRPELYCLSDDVKVQDLYKEKLKLRLETQARRPDHYGYQHGGTTSATMKNINATLLQQPGAPEQTVGGTRQKGNYASAAHLLQQRQKLQNATSQDLMLEYDLVEKKDDDMLHSHLSGFLRFLHAEDAVERANFIQRVKQEAGKISGGGASTGEPFGGDQDHAGQGQGVGVVPAALADNLVFGESLKEDTGVQLWDFYQRDLRVDEEAEDLVLERQRTRDAAHDVEKEDGRTRRRRVYTDFRDKKDTSKRRTSGSTLRTHTSTKLPTNRRQKGRVAMKDRNRSSLLKTRTLRLPSGTKDGLDGTIAKLARSRNSTSSHKKGAVVVPDKINATDVVLAPPEQQQAEKSILKIQRDQIFTPQQDPTLYLTSPFTTMSVGHGLEPEVGNAVFLAAAKELLLWQIFGTKDGGLLLGGGGRGTAKMGPRGAAPNRDAEDDVTLSTETVFNTPGRKLFSAARNMFENQDGGGSRTTSRGGGNPSTDDTAVEQEGAVADQLSSVVHAEDSALKQVRATLEYPSNDADVGQVQPHKELSNDVVKLGDDVSIRVEYEFDNTNSFYHDRIFQTFTFRDHSRSLSYELEVVAVQQSGEPSDVERLRPGEVVDAGAATHATGTTAGAASSSSLLPLPIFVPCSHWRTEAVTVSI